LCQRVSHFGIDGPVYLTPAVEAQRKKQESNPQKRNYLLHIFNLSMFVMFEGFEEFEMFEGSEEFKGFSFLQLFKLSKQEKHFKLF
jgi:hypothetical protein